MYITIIYTKKPASLLLLNFTTEFQTRKRCFNNLSS